MVITRTEPAQGLVTVAWRVESKHEKGSVKNVFNATAGTMLFREVVLCKFYFNIFTHSYLLIFQGQTSETIGLKLLSSKTPKMNEEYSVTLHDLSTYGMYIDVLT